MTQLPIEPERFWFWVTFVAFLVVSCIVLVVLPRFSDKVPDPFEEVQERLGLSDLPPFVFFLSVFLWLALFLTLSFGLVNLILTIIWKAQPSGSETWDFRFSLAKLTALTATLAAVVALPFTVVRLKLTREQTQTAAQTLLNERINAAVEALHAQRQVTKEIIGDDDIATFHDIWEDDVIRRNGAIDALQGLVKENPEIAPRVADMLSVYVRELSRVYPAVPVPAGMEGEDLLEWAYSLSPARSDMEKAVQTLGRLQTLKGVIKKEVKIDLNGANLQGMSLNDLTFGNKANFRHARIQGANLYRAQMQEAHLSWAQMQGADLIWAQMQGADLGAAEMQGANLRLAKMQGAVLIDAEMQGADLIRAQMQGADLYRAEMQGAVLIGAQMQGATLTGAEFDESTDLRPATLRGAAMRSVDFTTLPQITAHLQDVFGDRSVTLPEGTSDYPTHWNQDDPPPKIVFYGENDKFTQDWRAWQRSIGMNPDGTEADAPDDA